MNKDSLNKSVLLFTYIIMVVMVAVFAGALFVPSISQTLGSFNTLVMLPFVFILGIFILLQNKKSNKISDMAKSVTRDVSETKESIRQILSSSQKNLTATLNQIRKHNTENHDGMDTKIESKLAGLLQENERFMDKIKSI